MAKTPPLKTYRLDSQNDMNALVKQIQEGANGARVGSSINFGSAKVLTPEGHTYTLTVHSFADKRLTGNGIRSNTLYVGASGGLVSEKGAERAVEALYEKGLPAEGITHASRVPFLEGRPVLEIPVGAPVAEYDKYFGYVAVDALRTALKAYEKRPGKIQ